MEILAGKIVTNETTKTAMGGTELIAHRLVDSLDPKLLEDYQIIFSRVRELDPTKIRLYYAHDLPEDPEADKALLNDGWKDFHKIIFVSNWQQQAFAAQYKIPPSHCYVMQNAIYPIDVDVTAKPKDTIRLAYWSTPHRGLELLVPVFKELVKSFDNIELDVFSSFKLYGWEVRDKPYQKVIDECIEHEKINYHGTVSNDELREYLKTAHILAYPSIWLETSCMVLMEAMSAGMLCVHPNFGALYETAANWTMMYPFDEDHSRHAQTFYNHLTHAINIINTDSIVSRLETQKTYTDVFYGWPQRVHQWNHLLTNGFEGVDRSIPDRKQYFRFKTI